MRRFLDRRRRSAATTPARPVGGFVVGHAVAVGEGEGEADVDRRLTVVHMVPPVFAARVVSADEAGDGPVLEDIGLADVRWTGGVPEARRAEPLLLGALTAALAWIRADEERRGPHAVFLAAVRRKAARHRDGALSALAVQLAEAMVPELDAGLPVGVAVFADPAHAEAVMGAQEAVALNVPTARLAALLEEAGAEAGFGVVPVEVRPDVLTAWLREHGRADDLPIEDDRLAAFLAAAALVHAPRATALAAIAEGAGPPGLSPERHPAAHMPVSDDNDAPPADIPEAPRDDPFRNIKTGSLLSQG